MEFTNVNSMAYVPTFGKAVNTKAATNPIIENKENNEEKKSDNKKKIALALGALAAVGIAAIAIKKGKFGNIVKSGAKEGQEQLAKTTQKVSQEVAEKTAEKAGEKASKAVKKTVEEVTEKAQELVADGQTHKQIKRTLRRNLSHGDKKVVSQALDGVVAAKRKAEAALTEKAATAIEAGKTALAATAEAGQGIKNATQEVLQAKVQQAQTGFDKAVEAVTQMAEVAVANPTRKNQQRLQVARNIAEETLVQGAKVEAKAQETLAQLAETTAKKAEARAQMLADPGYIASAAKRAANEAKQAASKVTREVARDMKKPAFQNILEQIRRKGNPESRLAEAKRILGSKKSTDIQKAAAQFFLDGLAK